MADFQSSKAILRDSSASAASFCETKFSVFQNHHFQPAEESPFEGVAAPATGSLLAAECTGNGSSSLAQPANKAAVRMARSSKRDRFMAASTLP